MKLEDQVTNLEISKKMKELGFRQESIFWWQPDPKVAASYGLKKIKYDGYVLSSSLKHQPGKMKILHGFSAFTVAELGEMLPDFTVSAHAPSKYPNAPAHLRMSWVCDIADGSHQVTEDTEANARGLMAIHLKEKGVI